MFIYGIAGVGAIAAKVKIVGRKAMQAIMTAATTIPVTRSIQFERQCTLVYLISLSRSLDGEFNSKANFKDMIFKMSAIIAVRVCQK